MTTTMKGTHFGAESCDRFSRLTRDVFWLRWGRDAREGDSMDDARMEEVNRWVLSCGPLPREPSQAEQARITMLREMPDAHGATPCGPEHCLCPKWDR